MKYFIILSFILSFLTACTTSTLKAPCDASGRFCGSRLPVNSWYVEN